MSAHAQRAQILLEMNRHADAEAEVLRALAIEPNDCVLHCWLAVCRLWRGEIIGALQAARTGVGLDPENAYAHYTLARVLNRRGEEQLALRSVEESLRLAPNDADYHYLYGAIHYDLARWQQALASAESGLRHDPNHKQCINLRGLALDRLGHRREAAQTLERALAADPEYYWSHQNKAELALRSGDVTTALNHFREALRLDPSNELARNGLVESLKSRNVIYRWVLWLFVAKPGDSIYVGLGRGLMVSAIVCALPSLILAIGSWWSGASFAETMIGLAGFCFGTLILAFIAYLIVMVVYHLFGWTLFVVMLRFDPLGRHVLSREEFQQANGVMACFGLATLLALTAAVTQNGVWMGGTLLALFAALPVSAYLREPSGPRKRWGAALFIGMPLVWICGGALLESGLLPDSDNTRFACMCAGLGYGYFVSRKIKKLRSA